MHTIAARLRERPSGRWLLAVLYAASRSVKQAFDEEFLRVRLAGCAERSVGPKILVNESHTPAIALVVCDNLAAGAQGLARARRCWVAFPPNALNQISCQGAFPHAVVIEQAPKFGGFAPTDLRRRHGVDGDV
jgi:hypothetical protein